MTIGVLHPGAMGSAIGAALVDDGHDVMWASAGRSAATRSRASNGGLVDAGEVAALTHESELVMSICPPGAALEVARSVAKAARNKSGWFYLDANAVAPATAILIADVVEKSGASFVDGGIIGPPPVRPGSTRLYLSGTSALEVKEMLATKRLDVRVVDERPGSASALKLSYAAWSKGSAALLLTAREAARRSGVEDHLLDEWRQSQGELLKRWEAAGRSAIDKGWRWSGEMSEIAAMLDELGLPSGFHVAAAEVFEHPADFVESPRSPE